MKEAIYTTFGNVQIGEKQEIVISIFNNLKGVLSSECVESSGSRTVYVFWLDYKKRNSETDKKEQAYITCTFENGNLYSKFGFF